MRGCVQSRIDNGAGQTLGWRREPIVHPDAVAPRFNKAALPQVRQMARHGRLWQVERLVDVADAHLSGCEQRKNPQARAVAERFEQILETVKLIAWHGSIIFALTNTWQPTIFA